MFGNISSIYLMSLGCVILNIKKLEPNVNQTTSQSQNIQEVQITQPNNNNYQTPFEH